MISYFDYYDLHLGIWEKPLKKQLLRFNKLSDYSVLHHKEIFDDELLAQSLTLRLNFTGLKMSLPF